MDLVGVSCYKGGAADCLRHQVREEPTVLQIIFKGEALLFCYGLLCKNQLSEESIQTNSLLKQCVVIGEMLVMLRHPHPTSDTFMNCSAHTKILLLCMNYNQHLLVM